MSLFTEIATFTLSNQWQFTDVLVGSYFRVVHLTQPLNQDGQLQESSAAIAQADITGFIYTQDDFSYQADPQSFILEQPESLEVRKLGFRLLPGQTSWDIRIEALDATRLTGVGGYSAEAIDALLLLKANEAEVYRKSAVDALLLLKADKGDADAGGVGAQGLKGDKGDKGDTGEPGAAGAAGAQGIQGLKGDKGDKGDTGAAGAQGLKGDKGDAGSVGALPKGSFVRRYSSQFLPSGAAAAMQWNTEDTNSQNYWDSNNPTRLTVSSAGIYLIGFNIGLNNVGPNASLVFKLRRNGDNGLNQAKVTAYQPPNGASQCFAAFSQPIICSANDYFEVIAQNSGDGTETMASNIYNPCFFFMQKISD